MIVYSIPVLIGEYSFTETIDLAGESYDLRFVRNDRGDHWTISAKRADGTTLFAARTLAIGVDLLSRASIPKPSGTLTVLINDPNPATPGKDTFGVDDSRYRLVYASPD